MFPSLQHAKQHFFLDSAPPFGCHLVCLLPFPAVLPGRVSANSFLSACHPASTLPTPGEVLQPRAPHDFPLPKSKHLPWLLVLSQSGHSLPLDLPVLAPVQHLTLLITPSSLFILHFIPSCGFHTTLQMLIIPMLHIYVSSEDLVPEFQIHTASPQSLVPRAACHEL